ncbi:Hypothetical predicted protein, partial [Paramuricea clavata]
AFENIFYYAKPKELTIDIRLRVQTDHQNGLTNYRRWQLCRQEDFQLILTEFIKQRGGRQGGSTILPSSNLRLSAK